MLGNLITSEVFNRVSKTIVEPNNHEKQVEPRQLITVAIFELSRLNLGDSVSCNQLVFNPLSLGQLYRGKFRPLCLA